MTTWLIRGLVAVVFSLVAAQAGNVPSAKKALEVATTSESSVASNRLIRLEGTGSDSDMRPRQWDLTFFDSKRKNKGTVVRVKDGAAVSVAGAVRVMDDARVDAGLRNFTGYSPAEVINLARWKLDSNEALAKVSGLAGLEKVQLTDVKMELQKLSDGDVAPVWRVRVKARLRDKPGNENWIGGVELSAETGEILRNDLNVDRLNKKRLF
ncbi:MAG: hypothetical protein PCFJNLEI_03772 [Verrucomicrobiae bacterium]|nr:hypothetical protein [Verrucomicrobiae bacterium]